MSIGIYKITCTSNNAIYIGQSTNIEKRWKSYKSLRCQSQSRIYRSLKKYGISNHEFEIIEQCNKVCLTDKEKYWISHFDTFGTSRGMNLKEPGRGGRLSNETKLKKSLSLKGRPLSEENKKNISIANTGKVRTKEMLFNLSKAHMGIKLKAESIAKRTASRSGYKHSESSRAKTKESVKKSWEKRSRVLRPETKAKIKAGMAKRKLLLSERMS